MEKSRKSRIDVYVTPQIDALLRLISSNTGRSRGDIIITLCTKALYDPDLVANMFPECRHAIATALAPKSHSATTAHSQSTAFPYGTACGPDKPVERHTVEIPDFKAPQPTALNQYIPDDHPYFYDDDGNAYDKLTNEPVSPEAMEG